MAFFVYIAILLVSITGILLELDWLTKPKLDTKSPVQSATAVLPGAPPAKPKTEGPNPELNPVYPKKPDVARTIEPLPPVQRAETTGSAPAAAPADEPPTVESQSEPPRQAALPAVAKAEPPQQQTPEQANAAAAPAANPSPPAQTASLTSQNPSGAAPNKCNVRGCAAAYASFRAEDCTYQPLEGPRRVCEKAPAARGDQTARKRSKTDELRDVEAAVRRLRPVTAQQADADDDAGNMRGGRRVIVIERPWRSPW